MTDWLAAQAARELDKTALIFERQSFSFQTLSELAGSWAGRLQGAGVAQGDRVALHLSNRPEYAALVFAVMRLGAVVVPLNVRLRAAELEVQLSRANPKLLISEAELFRSVASLSTLLPCYLIDETPVNDALGTHSFVEAEPIPEGQVDLESPLCILFTSGTTGTPKGVVLSLGNFFYSATASAYRLGVQPNDLWLCTLPLYHVGGLSILLRSSLYGTAVNLHSRFELAEVTRVLSQEPVTLVSLVPTMLYRLLESPDFQPNEALRLVLLGGAAASEVLLEKASERGLPVATTYGLSEACSQVTTARPEKARAKPGTVGKPLMFTQVRVTDAGGQEVAAGIIGEVWVQGSSVMQGYLDAGATAGALRDGWLHTGDLGYLDAEGDLFIVQRRADLIVTGGENVYPAEVERVLQKYPQVAEACVVGVPHPEWGQSVAAAVEPKTFEDNDRLLSDLEKLCRESLAGYKQPRAFLLLDELPRTSSGKPKREEIRALFAAQNS